MLEPVVRLRCFVPANPSRRAGSELRGQGESPVELPAAPVPTVLRVPGHPSSGFGIQWETCQENGMDVRLGLSLASLSFEGN